MPARGPSRSGLPSSHKLWDENESFMLGGVQRSHTSAARAICMWSKNNVCSGKRNIPERFSPLLAPKQRVENRSLGRDLKELLVRALSFQFKTLNDLAKALSPCLSCLFTVLTLCPWRVVSASYPLVR